MHKLLVLIVCVFLVFSTFSGTIKFAYAAYLTRDQMIAAWDLLETTYPSIVSSEVLGYSFQGREIKLYKIGNPDGGRFAIVGNIHGEENPSVETLYAFALWACSSSDVDAVNIRQRNYLLLLPLVCIDSYASRSSNQNGTYGTNLYFNFDVGFGTAGSGDPTKWNYRGANALDQIESQIVKNFYLTWLPHIALSVHDGQTGNYTWYVGGIDSVDRTYIESIYAEYIIKAAMDGVPTYALGQNAYGGGRPEACAYFDSNKTIQALIVEAVDWTPPNRPSYEEIASHYTPKMMPLYITLAQACETVEETVEFSNGFEEGDFTAWTGNTTTGSSTLDVTYDHKFEGSYSARFNLIGTGATDYSQINHYLPTPKTSLYARAYFYFSSLNLSSANSRVSLIQWDHEGFNHTTNLQIINYSSVYQWRLSCYNGIVFQTWYNSTEPPIENQWYCLELYSLISDTDGVIRAWVNGTKIQEGTGLNTTLYGNITAIWFGTQGLSLTSGSNCTTFVDAAQISSSYIGPLPPSVSPTEIFRDGFESGDTSEWDTEIKSANCNVTVQTSIVHNGTYAVKVELENSSITAKDCRIQKTFSEETTTYARGYFRFTADVLGNLTTSGDRIALIYLSPTSGWDKGVIGIRNDSGTIKFYISGLLTSTSTTYASSSTTLPIPDVWYCLELKILVGDGTGESRGWINGNEELLVSNLNNTRDGNLTKASFGAHGIDVDNPVFLYNDNNVISESFIGTEGSNPPPTIFPAQWAIVANKTGISYANYLLWMLGNQSIQYVECTQTQVANLSDIENATGLILWQNSSTTYNTTAIKEYARTKPVLIDWYDFANILYTNIGLTNISTVSYGSVYGNVTFLANFSYFTTGDVVVMDEYNSIGIHQLRTCNTSALTIFGNITTYSQYNATHASFIRMAGDVAGSGFYVLDLFTVSPTPLESGIWHSMAVVNTFTPLKLGNYTRWMQGSQGKNWMTLDQVNTWITNFVASNTDIASTESIGTSVGARNINQLILGSGSSHIIVDGAIHGNEKTGTAACIRLAEYIVTDYRANGPWKLKLSLVTLHIVPIINVDGYTYSTNGRRENDNGIDLNRQFPVGATTTEPEAWALRWLMDNCTADGGLALYINNHEGWEYDPNYLFYPRAYLSGAVKTYFENNLNDMVSNWLDVNAWGSLTANNKTTNLNQAIVVDGATVSTKMAIFYPSSMWNTPCVLIEDQMWTSFNGARQCLLGVDMHMNCMLETLEHYAYMPTNLFNIRADAKISSAVFVNMTETLTVQLNTTFLGSTANLTTLIHVGTRGEPSYVTIDSLLKLPNDSWIYSDNQVTVTGILTNITLTFFTSTPVGCRYKLDKPTYFQSLGGSYITFGTSLYPLNFTDMYRGIDGYWNFNTTKIRTTVSMTITVFCGGNWTNYTITGVGTQNIYNGSKPTEVWIDGVNVAENSGWTYSSGITTVTAALSNVSLDWATTITPPVTTPVTTYTTYLEDDFNTLDNWTTVGNVTLEDDGVNYFLNVSANTGGTNMATHLFNTTSFTDFIFECQIKIGAGTTAQTRGLFTIYAYIDNIVQELFNIVYDGNNSRFYVRWEQQGSFINAQHDNKSWTMMGEDEWHKIVFAYDSSLGYGWFVLDYSLRMQIPYMVNTTDTHMERLHSIVLGSYINPGYDGVTYYDNVTVKSMQPSNTFTPASNKVVVFWWQIIPHYGVLEPPCHIGLAPNATILPGYYEAGQNYTVEMNLHYANGARWFIIETERPTDSNDVEVINTFKTYHPDTHIMLWLTENDTYDAHPVQNMTGVDYFINSVYLNRWENYDLYAMYNPIMVFRLYGLEERNIIALAIDDAHPSNPGETYGPTNTQFQTQIDFLVDHHPVMPGIGYFTWGWLTGTQFVSKELMAYVLDDVTMVQIWGLPSYYLSIWYAEPVPFASYNNASTLGFNYNVSITFFAETSNTINVTASSVTNQSFYLFGYAPSKPDFFVINVNGALVPVADSMYLDESKVFRVTMPYGDSWNVDIYVYSNIWIPIRQAMGVAGFGIMFIMPLLIIRKAREHDWKWVLMPGFVSLVLGYCLIVGWLWP